MEFTLTFPQWLMVITASLLCGMAKSGVAGLGIVLVPVLAHVFPAKQSVGILLPMLIAGDILGVLWYRRHVVWSALARCLPLALLGIVGAYLTMRCCDISDRGLRFGIGITVLLMLGLSTWQKWRADHKLPPAVPDAACPQPENSPAASAASGFFRRWLPTLFFGLAGGFASMMANAAGPLFVMYLLYLGLKKDSFVGTHAFLFLLVNLTKAPLQWDLGNITSATLRFNLLTLPLIFIGFLLGREIVKRLSQKWFERLVRGLTAIAALKLLG